MKRASTNVRERNQRYQLCVRQNWLCHWCQQPMTWLSPYPPGGAVPSHAATVDHLDSRLDADRGKQVTRYRRVAACWACNQKRSKVSVAVLGLAELHRRSGRYPRPA